MSHHWRKALQILLQFFCVLAISCCSQRTSPFMRTISVSDYTTQNTHCLQMKKPSMVTRLSVCALCKRTGVLDIFEIELCVTILFDVIMTQPTAVLLRISKQRSHSNVTKSYRKALYVYSRLIQKEMRHDDSSQHRTPITDANTLFKFIMIFRHDIFSRRQGTRHFSYKKSSNDRHLDTF